MVKAPEVLNPQPERNEEYPDFFNTMSEKMRSAVLEYVEKGDFSTATLIVSQLPGEIRHAFTLWRMEQEELGPITRS